MSNGILNDEEKLTVLETLLGNVVMPQQMSVAPTNKQMIDAAILRGSLELLKPKQPNENFASQASRALEAAGQPAKTLAAAQAAEAAARAKGMRPQVSVTTPKLFVFKNVASNLFDNNEIFRKTVELLTDDGIFRMKSPTIQALAGNAISYQSENGGSIENAIMKSAEGMLNLKTTGGIKNIPNNSDNSNSNVNSSDASKPKIPGIIIK